MSNPFGKLLLLVELFVIILVFQVIYAKLTGGDSIDLPDLILDTNLLQNYEITMEYIPSNTCQTCIKELGERLIMRFNIGIANIGTTDFILDPNETSSITNYIRVKDTNIMRNGFDFNCLHKMIKIKQTPSIVMYIKSTGNIPNNAQFFNALRKFFQKKKCKTIQASLL